MKRELRTTALAQDAVLDLEVFISFAECFEARATEAVAQSTVTVAATVGGGGALIGRRRKGVLGKGTQRRRCSGGVRWIDPWCFSGAVRWV